MTNADDKYAPPRQTESDAAHTLAKAGLNLIPFVGGTAAELLGWIIAPPLQKRQTEWMTEVGEGLKEVERKVEGFSIDKLSDNQQFVSAVMNASQAAIRNHQQEKREALRNAVLNVAVGSGLTEDTEAIFLFVVEHCTAWHLRILRLFQNPLELGREKGLTPDKYYIGSRTQLLEEYYPDMRGQQQFYGIVVADLRANGMLAADLSAMISANGMFQKITTEWADQFLKFITSPV